MSLRTKRVLYVALPLLTIAVLCATHPLFIWLSHHMPPCFFCRITNLYCPGCGNSRSVRALLNGQLWLSLRYNITPILSIVIGALGYAEWGFSLFSCPKRLLPRKPVAIVLFGLLLCAYFVARNIWEFMPA